MRRYTAVTLSVFCLALLLVFVPQRSTFAAVFPASDAATLINFINLANTAADPDVISLTGDITLTAINNAVDGNNGLPSITTPITIEGGGYTISGNNTFRIFHVAAAGTLTLNNVTITGGADTNGGGIYSNGVLTITGSAITANQGFGTGGGITSNGTAIITNSIISNNMTSGLGGGAGINSSGSLTVIGSSILNNGTGLGPGGIYSSNVAIIRDSTISGNVGPGIVAGGTLTVENSTISNNINGTFVGGVGINGPAGSTINIINSTISGNNAPGIVSSATATILNSTIVGNQIGLDDGFGFITWDIRNSIIANNAGGDCTIGGTITGINNLDLDGSCPGSALLTGTLGGLADNGGATFTHSPGTGASNSIDGVPIPACPPPPTDQRGVPRDWDGNSDGIVQCDNGSYELNVDLPYLDFNFDVLDFVEDPPGTSTVNITLTFPAPGPIQVFFKITGTATVGLDYTVSGLDRVYSLIIPAGATTASFSVTAINDGIDEPVENLALEMAFIGPARRVLSGAGGTRTLAVIRERPRPAPTATPINSGFQPSLLKAGFVRGSLVEWVITVGNTGTVAGTNVTIVDVVPGDYSINRVVVPDGSSTVSGQTVTITLPTLAPGQTTQISIFTTAQRVTNAANTVSLSAANYSGTLTTTGLPIRQLPATGETPAWRKWALLGLGISLVGLLWLAR